MGKKRPRRLGHGLALSRRSGLHGLDPRLYRGCRGVLVRRTRVEPVVQALTQAENAWPVFALGALAVDRRRRGQWWHASASMGLVFATTKTLSKAVGRPRPYFADCPPASHKADFQRFPSTHSATAFAALVAVPPLLPRAPLVAIAAATAGGRLLLGEHYPSDVLAGAVLGMGIAGIRRQGVSRRAGMPDAHKRAPADAGPPRFTAAEVP